MKMRMTTTEHAELGPKLKAARNEVLHALVLVCNRFPSAHPAVRALVHAYSELDEARNKLDSEYHSVTSDAEFAHLGHVYY